MDRSDFDTPYMSVKPVTAHVVWGPYGPTWSALEAMERFAAECHTFVAVIGPDERTFQIHGDPGVEYLLEDWMRGWVVKELVQVEQ